MHKFSVGVLGATGYAGRELCAIVRRHPALVLAFASARENTEVAAAVASGGVAVVRHDDAPLDSVDVVFSALPHGASVPWVKRARDAGARVVDLSSDLRPAPGKPAAAPYGLPELMRSDLHGAGVVANPGCYATAVLLAIAPLARMQLLDAHALITVNAASGVTGAGAAPRRDLMFAEVTGDFRAYAVGNEHRHLDEMRAVLASLGSDNDIVFTPHLLPVARGILATITVSLEAPLASPLAPWREMYSSEPFVELADGPPTLGEVVHRNVVRISVTPAAGLRRPALVIVSAIDNLVKGAAGQAVQNANILLGIDETLGLET
ncbi:MAG: N-acetyl-gamma-glutamyl-phosphate reductase [Gemmatimonadaceae bacterium]